jgi:uncharacterized protein (DUF362 family)
MQKENIATAVQGAANYSKSEEIVAQLFLTAGYDYKNRLSEQWNPLGFLISEGDFVLIKPNWIKESHLYKPHEWDYVITHPSIIKEVVRYTIKALHGKGKIYIGDSPQTDSSFYTLYNNCGLADLEKEVHVLMDIHKDLDIRILDLREEEWKTKSGVVVKKKKLLGDPLGYVVFDLGEQSEFIRHKGVGSYYGAAYDMEETNSMHNGIVNKYRVCGSVPSADVIINIPKLKTHKKAGITASLKNMVGINGAKNWLPHFTNGTPENNGDQFPKSKRKSEIEAILLKNIKKIISYANFLSILFVYLKKIGDQIFGTTEQVVRSGNWYGNDTIWRTILDLNKILFYGTKDGTFSSKPRRYLTIIDGIYGGQGNGPMAPDKVESGILIMSPNPVTCDCTAAKLMGFDYKKIPSLSNAFKITKMLIVDFQHKDIMVQSNNANWNMKLESIDSKNCFHFEPHFGWKEHIEL